MQQIAGCSKLGLGQDAQRFAENPDTSEASRNRTLFRRSGFYVSPDCSYLSAGMRKRCGHIGCDGFCCTLKELQ